MQYQKTDPIHASPPEPVRTEIRQNPSGRPLPNKPPRKPDWLVILIGVLILITLLIAGLFNIFGF